ncbi:hypothetical protein NP233_g2765 [Leucocoprinus birnbaumii]|uniref:glutathione transferase n=1 Tax=Leucocoprinus birnbaumii TaxID=56174 RepID=A0AAD5W1L9_9AGAR|nr:hypothetical protein NP233_g2765 [Leucocoprinus birnbaumii]
MVVKLYGFRISTATRRVAQILHEKRVPFEFIDLDRATSQQKSPEHLARQPFGQVPVLDDDGFIIYESRAISRYIATKWADRGDALIPLSNIQAIALFEQAASVEVSNFDPYATRAVFQKVFKPKRGWGETDVAIFEEAVKALHPKLDVYEELTLVDLFHLPFGSELPETGVDFFTGRPNFTRWFKDITSRPSWIAVKDGVESKPSYD